MWWRLHCEQPEAWGGLRSPLDHCIHASSADGRYKCDDDTNTYKQQLCHAVHWHGFSGLRYVRGNCAARLSTVLDVLVHAQDKGTLHMQ